jgi:hypothetical protein
MAHYRWSRRGVLPGPRNANSSNLTLAPEDNSVVRARWEGTTDGEEGANIAECPDQECRSDLDDDERGVSVSSGVRS